MSPAANRATDIASPVCRGRDAVPAATAAGTSPVSVRAITDGGSSSGSLILSALLPSLLPLFAALLASLRTHLLAVLAHVVAGHAAVAIDIHPCEPGRRGRLELGLRDHAVAVGIKTLQHALTATFHPLLKLGIDLFRSHLPVAVGIVARELLADEFGDFLGRDLLVAVGVETVEHPAVPMFAAGGVDGATEADHQCSDDCRALEVGLPRHAVAPSFVDTGGALPARSID